MRWFLVSAVLVVLGTMLLFNFASEAKAEAGDFRIPVNGFKIFNSGRANELFC